MVEDEIRRNRAKLEEQVETLPTLRVDRVLIRQRHRDSFNHKHAFDYYEQSLRATKDDVILTTLLRRECFTVTHRDYGMLRFDVASIKYLLAHNRVNFNMYRCKLTQEWVDYTMLAGGVEEEGLARLTREDLLRPGIMVFVDERHQTMIDGSHRLVRMWREGKRYYEFAMVWVGDILDHMCEVGGEEEMFDNALKLYEGR